MAGQFAEAQLDPNITIGCKFTVQFSRTKVYTQGGRLTQRFNWTKPKHILDLSYIPRPRTSYAWLLDLFYVVMANGYVGFRVKNWGDYFLTHENSWMTQVDGGEWQLQRVHYFGEAIFKRDIYKPVPGTCRIYRHSGGLGGFVSEATDATLDSTTGRATIPAHGAGDVYTVLGQFDLPMTFTNDEWVTNLEATVQDLYQSPDPILLEEILL